MPLPEFREKGKTLRLVAANPTHDKAYQDAVQSVGI